MIKKKSIKKTQKKTLYIITDIIIALLLIILKITALSGIEVSIAIRIIGLMSVIILLLFIKQNKNLSGKILNLCTVFLIFLYIFSFGQILLFSIGIDKSYLFVFKVSNYNDIYWAEYYSILSLILFHIGQMVFISAPFKNLTKDKDETNSLRFIAILGLILSVAPFIYNLLSKFIVSMTSGYSALYTQGYAQNSIIYYLSNFFIPSIFIVYYYNDKKIIQNAISIILLLIIIMDLLIGARGDAFTILTAFLLLKYTSGEAIGKKQLFKIIIATILVITIIPIIANYRSAEDKSIKSLATISSETLFNQNKSPIVSTIAELGGSIHPLILTKKIIPQREPYKYGESYAASIAMIIPSKLLGGYSMADKAALDIWLQDKLKMTYGPGYSLFAETYYNFGYYGGIVFSFALGLFFSFFLNNMNNKSWYVKIFAIIFAYTSLMTARSPFHSTIRNAVYMYIVPVIIADYRIQRGKKNEKHR